MNKDEVYGEPRIKRQYKPLPPEQAIAKSMGKIMSGFERLCCLRIDGELNKVILKPHVMDIYTARDSINELIKIIEL